MARAEFAQNHHRQHDAASSTAIHDAGLHATANVVDRYALIYRRMPWPFSLATIIISPIMLLAAKSLPMLNFSAAKLPPPAAHGRARCFIYLRQI